MLPSYVSLAPRPTYAEMLRMNRKVLARLANGTGVVCAGIVTWIGSIELLWAVYSTVFA